MGHGPARRAADRRTRRDRLPPQPNQLHSTRQLDKQDDPGQIAADLLSHVFQIYGITHPLHAVGLYPRDWLELRELLGHPYSPTINSPGQERRLNVCLLIATATSNQLEPGVNVNNPLVLHNGTNHVQRPQYENGFTDEQLTEAVEQARVQGLLPPLEAFS